MVDYWIWANAFSTHWCCWTSSSYCWLIAPPLPIRCPHLLCLGPSMHVAWWQMTAASLQSHPLLWDWRRWGTDKSLWVPVVLIVQGWLYVSHFVHAFVPSDFPLQMLSSVQFCSLQLLSCVRLFAIPSTTVCQASLSITNSQSLLKLMSIESVMPSNHLILFHPFLLPPSIFPSFRVFSKESVLHTMWPKYWNFSFSIRTSNEYSGLISFRMDWLDLLAVQGTLKSLLEHHSSKASILQRSAFFSPFLTSIHD